MQDNKQAQQEAILNELRTLHWAKLQKPKHIKDKQEQITKDKAALPGH